MIDLHSVDFVDLIERLDLRNGRMTAGGIEVNYSCHRPEHSHGDESPSAYINSDTGLFMCHGCRFHGNIVDLVSDVQQVSKPTAESWLRSNYGVQYRSPIGGSMLEEIESFLRPLAPKPVSIAPPESWLLSVRLDWRSNDLEPFQKYMIDRGLSRDILEEFDVGYDYLSDRITIPVRALDGSLFGVKGRDWSGRHPAKYLSIGDYPGQQYPRYGFNTYKKSEVVFGLHRARDIRKAVACEGELNAMALKQMGIERPIALNGSDLSDCQRDLIVDEIEELIILFDADEAGEKGAREAGKSFSPYVRVRVADPLDVDPCDALRDGREYEILKALDRAQSPLAKHLLLG